MNIFWLDNDLEKAAMYHCDKHVVKMILESCQLLSSVIHHINRTHGPIFGTTMVYRETHRNHPCAVWARASSENYWTLLGLLENLLLEYTYRYGKIHKCTAVYETLCDYMDRVAEYLPVSSDMPIPQCMPDEFKGTDVVEAYRRYYNHKCAIIDMRWTKRQCPDWLRRAS